MRLSDLATNFLKTGSAILLTGLCASAAIGSELVYVPLNPSFGGNPQNGQTLLNSAQATNKHKDPAAGALSQKSSLEQFNEMLERSILSQLASAATSNVLGPAGKLTPGTVETGNFRIVITDLGGGVLQITTTDKVTGSSTSFVVGQ